MIIKRCMGSWRAGGMISVFGSLKTHLELCLAVTSLRTVASALIAFFASSDTIFHLEVRQTSLASNLVRIAPTVRSAGGPVGHRDTLPQELAHRRSVLLRRLRPLWMSVVFAWVLLRLSLLLFDVEEECGMVGAIPSLFVIIVSVPSGVNISRRRRAPTAWMRRFGWRRGTAAHIPQERGSTLAFLLAFLQRLEILGWNLAARHHGRDDRQGPVSCDRLIGVICCRAGKCRASQTAICPQVRPCSFYKSHR